ncbi:hypothetical protein C7271_04635 [filamentous cyanobacterium CCP5]|nr:hypothetical protein C7271_04635 [filamentous cyanobacterium CCP5]
MKPSLALDYLPFLESLLPLHARAGQQPDNLCGPYWVAMLLRAYGGLSVSAVEVAIAASTMVPREGNPVAWLPLGARSHLGPHYDRISTDPDLDKLGTSIGGLIQATAVLSREQFCLLPLQSDDWEKGLTNLWKLCQGYPAIVPLLNVHTRYFWRSELTPLQTMTYLAGGSITPSPADWQVGHFALLAGRLQGHQNTLYALLDTYPHFGWNGLHLQPPEALARALARPDLDTAGGVALFMAAHQKESLEPAIGRSGLRIAPWNNGSPEPTPP